MLRLQNLKKSFLEASGDTLQILDIPDFHVAPGEQLAMIGQSGCGKSTLLHVISGISRPDSGQVIVDGIDVTRLPEAGCDRYRADKIGYVFQTFNLLPGFTAAENVMCRRRPTPTGGRVRCGATTGSKVPWACRA